ncbi:peptidase [Mycobacterium sp. IS-1496]|uniref:PepSY-associated TM helix domain-containing protein n=1 Tax=Mycobacterium sp. IS-1496 TaxID=1772284 RepID=UPI00074177A1|nr:PepSY domain-containing protein [Mycobacterium sp. IS-1496]KUI26504.1 peptidase [Mycobacterium sp. IS-1496]
MTTTPEGRLDPPALELPTPSAFAALLRRLHFYAGVFVGPFLLIAAVSGGLYAIAPSIEQFVYRDYLHVAATGDWRPVTEQIRAAQAVRPDLTVTAVRPAAEAGETTRVLFDDPALGESERRAVFVDPATAQPLGDLAVYGSSGALPVRTWIDQLHRSLHLGEPGRVYSELAASWLWVITLAGVCLWWARSRRGRRLLTVDPAARGRTRTLDWHGAVGLWIAAGLLFLSATGLTWSHYAGDNIAALRTALSWTTPTVSTAVAASGHAHHGGHVVSGGDAPRVDEVDRVLRAARDAGVGGHVEVSIPAGADTAFTVAQTREPWVMSNNAVAVDGSTGQVTDTLWFADWPLAAKLAAWGIQLHMGLLFGLVNQVGLAVLAVALVTVIVRGYLMWWRRRPTHGGGTVGSPPRRGVLRGVSPAAAVVLVCAAAAVGWFVPLLGLSLLGFLAVDAAIGFAQRRNAVGALR